MLSDHSKRSLVTSGDRVPKRRKGKAFFSRTTLAQQRASRRQPTLAQSDGRGHYEWPTRSLVCPIEAGLRRSDGLWLWCSGSFPLTHETSRIPDMPQVRRFFLDHTHKVHVRDGY